LKKKVNSYLKNEAVLTWENWLRQKQHNGKKVQLKLNYLAIISLFFSVSLVAIIIGNYRFWYYLPSLYLWFINSIEIILFISAISYIYFTGKRFEKM
jgi:hypothetical protein